MFRKQMLNKNVCFQYCKKRARGSFFYCLPCVGDCSRVAALPLNQLQSLCDRNPRGVITLPLFIEGVPKGGGSIYTARDHCFVIASMGIKEEGDPKVNGLPSLL